jgi:hypothetical protein
LLTEDGLFRDTYKSLYKDFIKPNYNGGNNMSELQGKELEGKMGLGNMMEWLPDNINVTRLYISSKDSKKHLSENYIYYYLGKHNIFVHSMRRINDDSFIATILYDNLEDVKELYQKDTHKVKFRRIFKSAVYCKPLGEDLFPLNGLFAEMSANLLGLLKDKKAIVGVSVTPHRYKEIKAKFLEMSMKFRDEKNMTDIVFDPAVSNIDFNIHILKKENGRVEIITWVEDKENILG